MIINFLIIIAVLLVGFLGYVATRSGRFKYERSGVINASAEAIFPYLCRFSLGSRWSPYDKIDPNMKKTFYREDGEVGSIMEFQGNSQAGSGKLELLKSVPNQSVEIKLTMLKPFQAENLVQYNLTPEGAGTKFTWAMSGDGGYMSKLMTVLIDCDKMIGDQFSEGIANLKNVIESDNS
jgi:Polyketide cyclase / dehydrase and lipid transport